MKTEDALYITVTNISLKGIQRFEATPGFSLLCASAVTVVLKGAGAQAVCSGAGFPLRP